MRSFNRAWAVPRNERPNPIALRLRSLLLLLVLGAGVLVTTTLSGLTTDAGAFGATVSAGFGIAAIPLTTLVNVGLFMVAFRVLTASEVPARHLHIVAVVAGIGRQIVQVLGTYLVAHTLRGAPEAYGVVGPRAWSDRVDLSARAGHRVRGRDERRRPEAALAPGAAHTPLPTGCG
jgi:membrane protein